MYVNNDNI